MNVLVKKPKDLFSGLLFAAFGIFVFYVSLNYSFGTARRMGPGYFPGVLAALMVLIGAVLVVRSFFGAAEPIEKFSLKPMVLILLGSLLFGLLVRPAGLAPAIMAMIVVGSAGDASFRIVPAVATAAILALGSTILFVHLLGQPLPAFGYWFR